MSTAHTNRFTLGKLVATPGAIRKAQEMGSPLLRLVARHVSGDWGDMSEDDKQTNEDALTHGGRIFSAYVMSGVKFWIITEADRSATTILLPEEY